MIPLLYTLSTASFSYNDYDSYASKTVPEYKAHELYAKDFDMNKLNPMNVVMTAVPLDGGPTDSNTLVTLDREFGLRLCHFVHNIMEETRDEPYAISPNNIFGIWWDSTHGNCLSTVDQRAYALQGKCANDAGPCLSNDGLDQTLLLFAPASGKKAQDMTHKFWDTILPNAEQTFTVDGKKYKFKAYLDSGLAEEMNLEENIARAFPYIMTAIILTMGCLVGYSFASAFIMVKLVFTVFIPILANYGLLVGIYEYGWLSWLGVEPVGSLPWLMFFTTGPLLFALAIDYDMFLFARVYELRLDGYDNRAAVRIGLEETGPIITIAGSLMCIAFFSVFLLDLPIVSETGLLYFIGVGIDTYIVRMWIAPAVLCMFETLNYWPNKMPPGVKSYEDYENWCQTRDTLPMGVDEAAYETKPALTAFGS